jgi:hypothetical protein
MKYQIHINYREWEIISETFDFDFRGDFRRQDFWGQAGI